MEMTHELWQDTHAFITDVHGRQSEFMASIGPRATAAGLPDIAVTPEVGRLLQILTSLTNGGSGAGLVVELGTLAGYSAIWLAKGLSPDGRVISCDPNDTHADFAQTILDEAAVSDRVEIRRQPGLDLLTSLTEELGPATVDVVFLDAIKREYPAYFEHVRVLLKPGGILLADNALGAQSFWVTDAPGNSPETDGLTEFNRAVAAAPEFESSVVPLRQGVLIARKSNQ